MCMDILHDIGRCQPATKDQERDGVPIARDKLTKRAFDEPTFDHLACSGTVTPS